VGGPINIIDMVIRVSFTLNIPNFLLQPIKYHNISIGIKVSALSLSPIAKLGFFVIIILCLVKIMDFEVLYHN